MDVLNVYAAVEALQRGVSGALSFSPSDFGIRAGALGDAVNLYFFYEVKEFLNARIDRFAINLLGRMMTLVGIAALALMTMWVFFQGLRVLTGKSRDSMMEIVMQAAKAGLVISVATSVAAGGQPLIKFMADKTSTTIFQAVTGRNDTDPYRAIDKSLSYMQLAMISIDALDVSGDENIEAAKSRAQLFTGIGIAGPSLVGGTLLLLNRIMMALFIGLGPIFILCLLFDQTKHLFSKWLFYGIGTMFSLAVLSVMVSISLDIVTAVAAAFWVGNFMGGNTEGISSMALQQGGLGLIMTMLIVTVPPIAANFFQGTLGTFTQYSAFGGSSAPPGQRRDPAPTNASNAAPSYSPPPPEKPAGSQAGISRSMPDAPSSYNNPATNPRVEATANGRTDDVKKNLSQLRNRE